MVECSKCGKRVSFFDIEGSTGVHRANCYRCRAADTESTRRKSNEQLAHTKAIRRTGGIVRRSKKTPASTKVPTLRLQHDSHARFPDLDSYTSKNSRVSATARQAQNLQATQEDRQRRARKLARRSRQVEDQQERGARRVRHGDNDASSTNQPPESECSVCGETLAADQFPRLRGCTHEPQTCSECFSGWLASQIGSTTWDRIVCPAEDCNTLIKHRHMKKLVDQDTFEKYDRLSTISVLSDLPNFRHCLRPGCGSGQVHDGGDIFRCQVCDFLVCTTHDEPMHEGETCKQYDRRKKRDRKAENDASLALVRDTAQQCPNRKCKVKIEKISGCDHITCSKCQHEFCWECLAPYYTQRGAGIMEAGNSAHREDCTHYASYEPIENDESDEDD